MACLVDTEGSIGLRWLQNGPRKVFKISVSFTNTDPRLIQEITRILESWGIGFYYHPLKRPNRPTHQVCMYLEVVGLNRAKKLIQRVKPYLIAKREQAAIALEAVSYRQEKGFKGGKGIAEKDLIANDPYLLSLVGASRWLKRNCPSPLAYQRRANTMMRLAGESSETARRDRIKALFGEQVSGVIQSALLGD